MDQWTVAVLGAGGIGKTKLGSTFALNSFVGALLPSSCMPPIDVWTGMPPDEEPDPQFFKKQFVVDNHMCFVEVLTPTVGQVSKPPEDDILAKAQGFVLYEREMEAESQATQNHSGKGKKKNCIIL
ncbi:hypothetical protein MSAN_02447700 [Mycena sanguinolenta]|uniref:Uncharacterized protein n=1 Tax=Mycena sanguinolenta TaxID=230812 RepID=A0A8H6WXX9_9AGAR|nr:hypothetical protein MSAN_02447700 [Mycena sanguinolenta]